MRLIVGALIAYCWKCGGSFLEKWWLVAESSGGSLLKIWWLNDGDLVAQNCTDKNLAKVIKIKPNGMYCKGRNHNFHWFGWAEMQGHVIESEKLRNKLFLEKITDLSLPFFLKTFLFPSQFIAKLFVSKHFWIVFFSFRGWQDNKEPGQDVCIHYAGKKVARTGCMH